MKFICALFPRKLMPNVSQIIGPSALFLVSDRLKEFLPNTIAPNQLAFVENRQILVASLMANELIDDWSRKGKDGVVLKLDLEKAFDTVDWDFLDARS